MKKKHHKTKLQKQTKTKAGNRTKIPQQQQKTKFFFFFKLYQNSNILLFQLQNVHTSASRANGQTLTGSYLHIPEVVIYT